MPPLSHAVGGGSFPWRRQGAPTRGRSSIPTSVLSVLSVFGRSRNRLRTLSLLSLPSSSAFSFSLPSFLQLPLPPLFPFFLASLSPALPLSRH